MNWLKNSAKRILIGLLVVILILLMSDFNNRMSDLHRLTAQRERAGRQATELVTTQIALETAIAYATSEAAVEEWAYEEGKMVRPGDQPVVPLPENPDRPTPTPQATPQPEPLSRWEVWMALFFDRDSQP